MSALQTEAKVLRPDRMHNRISTLRNTRLKTSRVARRMDDLYSSHSTDSVIGVTDIRRSERFQFCDEDELTTDAAAGDIQADA
jgi:hypothetical protein